jgi:hypothetical protein
MGGVARINSNNTSLRRETMTNYAKFFAAAALMMTAWTALPAQSQAYDNDYCREYTRTVFIGDRRQEAYGTACLRPDGQWEIVNEGSMRPVSYDNYVAQNNRTVYVQQPTQIVYRDRSPTRVFFFGSPRRDNRWYNDRYNRYDRHDRYDRYDHHDHDRGRGHR